jgi:hypothetical protein
MRRYDFHARDDGSAGYEGRTGRSANPDRKSDAIRKRERMVLISSESETDYTAMLSPESLASYLAYKNGEKKTDG